MSRTRAFAARLVTETLLATTASTAALAFAAIGEHRGLLQPLNATSHWLNGEAAAQQTALRWRTTGVGLATHLAATCFWATLFEVWLHLGRRSPQMILGRSVAVAGIAALVDYKATPKRFTPGWEFVLSPGAMTIGYFALGAGLALGAGRDDRANLGGPVK